MRKKEKQTIVIVALVIVGLILAGQFGLFGIFRFYDIETFDWDGITWKLESNDPFPSDFNKYGEYSFIHDTSIYSKILSKGSGSQFANTLVTSDLGLIFENIEKVEISFDGKTKTTCVGTSANSGLVMRLTSGANLLNLNTGCGQEKSVDKLVIERGLDNKWVVRSSLGTQAIILNENNPYELQFDYEIDKPCVGSDSSCLVQFSISDVNIIYESGQSPEEKLGTTLENASISEQTLDDLVLEIQEQEGIELTTQELIEVVEESNTQIQQIEKSQNRKLSNEEVSQILLKFLKAKPNPFNFEILLIIGVVFVLIILGFLFFRRK